MKVLLVNDDGITATGLNVMRQALLELPGIELAVIAPDSNRSATARSITIRHPLWVDEVEFGFPAIILPQPFTIARYPRSINPGVHG